MTVFTDADFKEAALHDGFSSRDKDFTAALEDYIIQPLGKKDSMAVSFRFSDDPEGEQLLSIFGIDGDKEGSYNKKMSWGAFVESVNKCGTKVLVAKKIKEGTNMDDPAYDYALKFDPPLKGTGKPMTMHIEKSKYTKDGVEKDSSTWTCTAIGVAGATTAGTATTSAPATINNDGAMVEMWRKLICDEEKCKLLGLPGTRKVLILNLKKVVTDEKIITAMQNVRDAAMEILEKESLIKIEKGVITPV